LAAIAPYSQDNADKEGYLVPSAFLACYGPFARIGQVTVSDGAIQAFGADYQVKNCTNWRRLLLKFEIYPDLKIFCCLSLTDRLLIDN
jgi:hypothetical protein